jgi:DNA repair protein SbcC/Rad50
MRPLKLRVAGLRSYRSERTLDFADRSLMAILGDTGSGKSSLLEAIYGALYGACTWEGRGLGPLIADGVKTLQIELVFTARGKTYTVSRSTSREAYPPAKHILNGPDGEHVDGDRAVTRRIEQIVGLTEKEFLRVVILPQGRFGQLLQGTAGERTPILRGILGLGALDQVRAIADQQSTELADALEPLVAARARLYPEPAAVAAEALKSVTEHQRSHAKLKAAANAIASVDSSRAAVEQALPGVNTALDQAQTLTLSAAIEQLAQADLAALTLDSDTTALKTRRATHEAAKKDLEGKLAAATAEGVTSESIALTTSALDRLVQGLPGLHHDALEQEKVSAELTAREAALNADTVTAATAKHQADQSKAALAEFETEVRRAAGMVREVRDRQSALTHLLETVEQRGRALEPAIGDLLQGALDLNVKQQDSASAKAGLAEAQGHLDTLRAANLVAHVSGGHKPGQPCPVCARELPKDFKPAAIMGEDELKATVASAEHNLGQATGNERAAERELDGYRRQMRAAADALSDAVALAEDAAHQAGWSATAEQGSATPGSSPVGSTLADALIEQAVDALVSARADQTAVEAAASNLAAQMGEYAAARAMTLAGVTSGAPQAQEHLAPLIAQEAAAQQALDRAKASAEQVATQAAKMEATLDAGTRQLEKDKQTLHENVERTVQTASRLVAEVRALPTTLAEMLSAALDLTAPDPTQAMLAASPPDAATETALRTALSDRAAELSAWTGARDNAREAIAQADRQLVQFADDRRRQVDLPRTAGRTALERAAGGVRTLTRCLPGLDLAWAKLVAAAPDLPALPERGPGLRDDIGSDCDDAALTAVTTAMAARLADALTAVASIRDAATAGLSQAQSSIMQALAATAVSTVADLMTDLTDVAHRLLEAQTRLQRAQAQEPVAAGLDEGLTTLRDRLAVLRAVKDQLSPSLFPKFVISQRQTALLRIASSLLATLTREAYGFGDDFMIVDRRTGQPRHAKTLSGGETFLASLALALALVEISNRSGGQLDALFLDEGFGSLDASILGDALDVLREQAAGGRLVGVISHLHAVAAELNDVLVVTKSIDGSDFRWLDADERDRYLLEDVSAGLLE